MNDELKQNPELDEADLTEEIMEAITDDTGEAEEEVPAEYYFTNPDPYAKVSPLPYEQRRHEFHFDTDGHIRVKNPSAFWLPELTLQKEINGTIYTVTGSYVGTETLDRRLTRIFENNLENREDSE
jgi:hypothetical protein